MDRGQPQVLAQLHPSRGRAGVRRRHQAPQAAWSPGADRAPVAQDAREFVEEDWWPRYAVPNLAADTRRRYLEIWGTHLLDRIGGYELREVTPLVVEDVRDEMTAAGVGAPTQRKAMMMLRGMLRRAVVHGLIPAYPVQLVAKPRQAPTRTPRPLSPASVEAIRGRLRPRDATIISLLAYAGLRPDEMMRAEWSDLAANTIHVQAHKTGRARDVDLLAPLSDDLRAWRLLSGRRAGLIVGRPTGGEWGREDWANWRSRVYRPAAEGAGVTGDLRPYRLRGRFVSLLLWEGRSLAYAADQAGHSIATLAKHYAGVIRELEEAPRVPAAQAIRDARDALRTHHQIEAAADQHKTPANRPMDDAGLEPVTSALSRSADPDREGQPTLW